MDPSRTFASQHHENILLDWVSFSIRWIPKHSDLTDLIL